MSGTRDTAGFRVATLLRSKLMRRWMPITALLVLGVIIFTNPASAGWLSWVGVALVIVAVAVAVFAAPIAVATGLTVGAVQAIAGATAVAGIVTQAVDVKVTLFGAGPTSQPTVAAAPEPPSASIPNLLANNYQPISTPGNEADALVNAVNGVINEANTVLDTDQPEEFAEAFEDFTDALDPVATEFADVFGDQELAIPELTFSEEEIDEIQAEIALSGLPDVITDSLIQTGFTASDIEDITDYVASTEINLSVPTVTGSQLLAEGANVELIPEPSTLFILGSGLTVLAAALGQRRLRQARPRRDKPSGIPWV